MDGPRVITVSLEDQGIERPDPPTYRDQQPRWVLPSSPYRYAGPSTPKKRHKDARFDRGQVRDVRSWVIAKKRREGCCVCGEREPACLHFHHRNPKEKLFDLGAAGRYDLAQVRAEAAKCDILCANCHAKVHSGVLRPRGRRGRLPAQPKTDGESKIDPGSSETGEGG